MRQQLGLQPNPYRYLAMRDDGAEGKGRVNCISYNPDGSRFLVVIQNLLVEYDSETLLPLRKKQFAGQIKSACYGSGYIIAASGINLILLDEDFSEMNVIQGTQIRAIRWVVDSYDGNGYYVLSGNGELKQLDQELTVRRIRNIQRKNQFIWVKDRRSGRPQLAFPPINSQKDGSRYTFETEQIEPLGWCYELLENLNDAEEQRIYTMGSQLMQVNSKPPYNKFIYDNYSGLYFFGCSFRNIHGNLSQVSNQEFIRQNGGIVDDFA